VEPKWNLIRINHFAQNAILYGQNIQIQNIPRIVVMFAVRNQSSLLKNPFVTPAIKNCINNQSPFFSIHPLPRFSIDSFSFCITLPHFNNPQSLLFFISENLCINPNTKAVMTLIYLYTEKWKRLISCSDNFQCLLR
jgi:hypothetical protein